MARKSDAAQSRYDDLLLDTVKGIDRKTDTLDTKIGEVAVVANKAHVEAKEARLQSTLTNSRVTHTEQNIEANLKEAHKIANGAKAVADRSQERLDELEAKVLPDKPPEPNKLPSVWNDPLIRKIIFIVGSIIILAAIGFSNEEIRGLFGE